MATLSWSENSQGVLNGKVGKYTLFTISLHTTFNRYFVAPKIIPGVKPIPVGTIAEGRKRAEHLLREFVAVLTA